MLTHIILIYWCWWWWYIDITDVGYQVSSLDFCGTLMSLIWKSPCIRGSPFLHVPFHKRILTLEKKCHKWHFLLGGFFRKVKSLSLKMKKKIIMIIACASRNYLLVCAKLDDCWQRNCNFSYFQQYLFWLFPLFSPVLNSGLGDRPGCLFFPPRHNISSKSSSQIFNASSVLVCTYLSCPLYSLYFWNCLSLCAFDGIFVVLFTKIGVKILRRRTWTGISIDHGSPVIYINTITIFYIRNVNALRVK